MDVVLPVVCAILPKLAQLIPLVHLLCSMEFV